MSKNSAEPSAPVEIPQSGRIVSIDVLRGFDMFWIVGGSGFVAGIIKLFNKDVQEALLPQLDHAAWEGFTFYDLIYPLFIFLVGVSIVFSIGKLVAQKGKWAAYRRIFRRGILIFLMGVIYYGGLANEWDHIRWLGVLQRIALCYFFTALLFSSMNLRALIITCAVFLVGYWAMLSFVPVPDLGATSFVEGKNWANYLDIQYLGGRKHDGLWDPEGLLSTIPSVATCLLGVFTGLIVRNRQIADMKKVLYFIAGGAVFLLAGYLWGLQFPIIKKIWTSSYVLVSAGYSLILLGIFYLIIDVWHLQKWATPFIWIGMNAITIYMARNLLSFNDLAMRFVGGDVQTLVSPEVGYLLKTTVSLALTFILVRFLYKHKIFLRF